MTIWHNADGLDVKFARDEAGKASGGEYNALDGRHVHEFIINASDVQSTTKSILGSLNGGTLGVVLPKGLFIEKMETVALAAFTSSGTIGSSTLEIGLIKASDRSTDYDVDGLTSTSFVGSAFDTLGETTTFTAGVGTGVGSSIGTQLTEDVIVTVLNSQHASHPYDLGQMRVRVYGYYK